MKNVMMILCLFFFVYSKAQDSTMNSLTKDMDGKDSITKKKPVKIFDSYKAINANTTEVTGKGKMDFSVTHNFGDIGGSNGGKATFFGLDNIADVRIGFNIGLGKRFDLIAARAKGFSGVQHLWQLGFKYKIMEQLENDPSHPLSIALFADAVVSTQKSDTTLTKESHFEDFSDRISNVIQLIFAKKIGRVSLQLNPTLMTRSHSQPGDQNKIFSLGGAVRLPLSRSINLILDYFHNFRNQESKDAFAANGVKFHDPIGVGFEILTAGHVFHLNFTNATEILENRFIPNTTSSWTKGQFRWGFNISRTFVLWREKR